MGKFAPVYLTAVLEYLTAEVLEQTGIISKLLKVDRVTPQSIRLAIREDKGKFKCSSNSPVYNFVSELDKLVPDAVFAYSGGGKREEICTRRTSLELRGLTQEEEDSHNSLRKSSKSGQGKKKKNEQNSFSEEEEDYLQPADSRHQRKS